jgi:hypothetical protein
MRLTVDLNNYRCIRAISGNPIPICEAAKEIGLTLNGRISHWKGDRISAVVFLIQLERHNTRHANLEGFEQVKAPFTWENLRKSTKGQQIVDEWLQEFMRKQHVLPLPRWRNFLNLDASFKLRFSFFCEDYFFSDLPDDINPEEIISRKLITNQIFSLIRYNDIFFQFKKYNFREKASRP